MAVDATLVSDIQGILQEARGRAYAAVNFVMVEAYWKIGERKVEEEQKGEQRAAYGSYLIKELSKQLIRVFGAGFSEVNLKSFRKFYLTFSDDEKGYAVRTELADSQKKGHAPGTESERSTFHKRLISQSLRKQLTWTHYRLIMRVDNPRARQYYMNEAADNNWSSRVLERDINSLYYERILSSTNKREELIQAKNEEKQSPADFIKDPYIFEFLNIPQHFSANEQQLEAALIENLQSFLLELGKGFSFIKRQFRINTESKSFAIDLVFYNYILKCFVLFDLKRGELTHQDVGQMDMYVRMFDDLQRSKDDNPTIGIILCTAKDETIVKYSILNDTEKLFATKYKLFLPTEEELIAEIEREKLLIEERLRNK